MDSCDYDEKTTLTPLLLQLKCCEMSHLILIPFFVSLIISYAGKYDGSLDLVVQTAPYSLWITTSRICKSWCFRKVDILM
jgi:hypothetical protein